MNNQELQKEKEKHLLFEFMTAYSDIPKGKLSVSESPDFIIKEGKKKSLGIEVTKLYLSKIHHDYSKKNKLNQIKENLINEIKNKLFNTGFSNLSCHFIFSKEFNSHPTRVNDLINQTTHIIEDKLNSQNFDTFFRLRINEQELSFPFKSVTFIHHPDNTISDWQFCNDKMTQNDFILSVNELIAKKEEKLILYQQKKFNRLWLIIASDCLQCSIHYNLNNLIEKRLFSSGFNKILLFDRFAAQVYELT